MYERVRNIAQSIKREIGVYVAAVHHPRTPWLAKVLLVLAVGYFLLPFDLIPDFLPVVGHLDDVVIILALLLLALWLTPREVMAECRATAYSSGMCVTAPSNGLEAEA